MDQPKMFKERALKVWGLFVMTVFVTGGLFFWYKFFTIPVGRDYRGPICACTQDDGAPPSSHTTEEDYYGMQPPK